ncbi:AAA family ATPase [Paenisporosarcina antarctica]|uniref:ATP-binding cassette domain-containing protein n=1 Tax=Paenisporosarcina antarctica TaxID=417367 RepID=A0A4P6ZZ11_9BACL|nr:AAA family ATPase [Paenisporosarcina antarctica]QBP41970.1 ATP-binding cassette domain-containing protein [Paenisporosarcina antarctica]
MSLRSVTIIKDKVNDRSYPFSIPSIKGSNSITFTSEVTFFVGENGSGKSTLLEAIAYQCGFNTAGGGRNNMYEIKSSNSTLGEHIRLSWLPKINQGFFLRAESFFHFASYLDQLSVDSPDIFRSYGGKSLHEQSHGEAFFSLFNNRFGQKGIYLLDEPEAALSPARQLALLRIIRQLVKEGNSQFIIATHSPILLGYPESKILNFDTTPVSEIEYEDTDHYQIMKGFLNRRDLYLKELFKEDTE